MAGTLQVNDRAAWTPAGWIFNYVLEAVAAHLAADDPALAETIQSALGPTPGHLDLSLASAGRFQRFTSAAEQAGRRLLQPGPTAFRGRHDHEGCVRETQVLLQLLHADPRCGSVSEAH